MLLRDRLVGECGTNAGDVAEVPEPSDYRGCVETPGHHQALRPGHVDSHRDVAHLLEDLR
jgi:hypothetical protein